MMSGDAPWHTREVSSKKGNFFFEILTLVGNFRDSSNFQNSNITYKYQDGEGREHEGT